MYNSEGKDLSRGTMNDTQEFINHLIGMGPAAFAHSVVFSKKVLKFPTLKDSEKKAIFDEILQLEVLDVGLNETKEVVKKLKEAKKTNTDKKKFLTASIERLQQEEKTTEAELNLWEGGRKERIEALKDIVADAEKEVSKLKKHVDTIHSKFSEAGKRLEKVRSAYDQMSALVREEEMKLSQAEVAYSKDRNRVLGEVELLNAEKVKITKLLSHGKCPTCQQSMSGSTLADDLDSIERKVSSLKTKLLACDELRTELDATESEIEEAKKQLSEEKAKISEVNTLTQKLRDNYDVAKEDYNDAVSEKTRQLTCLAFEEKASNPHKLKLESLQSSLSNDLADLTTVQDELAAIEVEIEEEDILEQAFKGAKLLMIKTALPLLNAEAVKIQSIMGTKLSVTFRLKASEESYGGSLVTDVFNPQGAKNYKGDSDGEQACVDWILLLSLLSLVSSRGKKSINQAFYDEVFDSLDEENEMGVLNVLKDISSTKSSVFMLSHSAVEIGGQCDQIWTVENGDLFKEAA